MSSPIPLSQYREEQLYSMERTQSSTEVLLSLQDRIRYWNRHAKDCSAVNCMTESISAMDIVFESNYPEYKSGQSIVFCHRFSYMTTKTANCDLQCNYENVDLLHVDNDLCIILRCYCDNEFSDKCIDLNLKFLCKLVMTVLDGTYPFPSTSTSSLDSGGKLQVKMTNTTQEKIMKDVLQNKFCSDCYTPILLCNCMEEALTRLDFLEQLSTFPLCKNCLSFQKGCYCPFAIYKLFQFYYTKVKNGLVRKRLNDVKRLAYLASCNVPMCFNCNRSYMHCLCCDEYQILYK
ncbi:E3 protein [unidentified adenovirus]|nr:E3 protein [unidentified adenovirus]ALB78219.1 E3 protein [unidentified adenovirus]